MNKLHMSPVSGKLAVAEPLIAIIALMHDFMAKFAKILEIHKEFAKNRVDRTETAHIAALHRVSWQVQN